MSDVVAEIDKTGWFECIYEMTPDGCPKLFAEMPIAPECILGMHGSLLLLRNHGDDAVISAETKGPQPKVIHRTN